MPYWWLECQSWMISFGCICHKLSYQNGCHSNRNQQIIAITKLVSDYVISRWCDQYLSWIIRFGCILLPRCKHRYRPVLMSTIIQMSHFIYFTDHGLVNASHFYYLLTMVLTWNICYFNVNKTDLYSLYSFVFLSTLLKSGQQNCNYVFSLKRNLPLSHQMINTQCVWYSLCFIINKYPHC